MIHNNSNNEIKSFVISSLHTKWTLAYSAFIDTQRWSIVNNPWVPKLATLCPLALFLTHGLQNIRVNFCRVLRDIHRFSTTNHDVGLKLLVVLFSTLVGRKWFVLLLIVLVIRSWGANLNNLLSILHLLLFFSTHSNWLICGLQMIFNFERRREIFSLGSIAAWGGFFNSRS